MMNTQEQKDCALNFLKALDNGGDTRILEPLLTDNFEFEMMGRLPGIAPMGEGKNS
jgi:hypothetical protein